MGHADSPRLGDVAEFIRGITFKPDDVVPTGTPGSVPCMRTKNVQEEIDLSDVWSVDARFVRRPGQYLETGDLLVSSANSWNLVGKCCWVPEGATGATFGGFIAALRPNPHVVHPRYLFHWFSSPRTQATVRSFGRQTTNISNLDFTRCLEMPILLPSLDEQERVASILDDVGDLRIKRSKAIALLGSLARSIFVDMFGDVESNPRAWPLARLDAASQFFGGATLPPGQPYSGQADGYFLLKVSDMNRPGNETWLRECHSWSSTSGPKASTCPAGTVIIPKRGAAISTNKKRITARPGILDPNLMGILPRPEILGLSYFYQWISEFNLTRIINGSSVPQLNKQDLAPLNIPTPPLERQREFASRIAQLDSIRDRNRSQLAELDSLLASLQHRAFFDQLWDSPAA